MVGDAGAFLRGRIANRIEMIGQEENFDDGEQHKEFDEDDRPEGFPECHATKAVHIKFDDAGHDSHGVGVLCALCFLCSLFCSLCSLCSMCSLCFVFCAPKSGQAIFCFLCLSLEMD